MSINVICTSSEERNNEIRDLFEKMKPYLFEGNSYNQALKIVMGGKTSYAHTRWFKDLVEYGESQGFLREDFTYSDRYGFFHVHKVKDKKSLTGYYWVYYYFENGKRRRISTNDLNVLKERVLERGLPWRVTNEYKAKRSLELNDTLQMNKRPSKIYSRGRKSRSGVRYVSIHTNRNSKKGFYWIYKYKDNFAQASSLRRLYDRVLGFGWDWIVIDEKLYEDNLLKEDLYEE